MTKGARSYPPDAVVIEADDRRQAVINVIRQARSKITLSLFRCNDKPLFAELAAAVARGVTVEAIVTSRAKGGKRKLQKLWQRLEATGASVHAYTDAVVKYHAKYLVVDDGPALIASLNFTRKCFTKTLDGIVVTYDPDVVQSLKQLMISDREGVAAPDTLSPRLILGPERARRQITALITNAKSSIRLIDAKLSDPGLTALLNQRRAQGVNVEIHGGKRLAGMKSHGKIMLIDGKSAVIGSLALAALSLDFRREVALIVEEPSGVAEIERVFSSINAEARAAGAVPSAAAGGATC